MIERYEDEGLKEIWCDKTVLSLWQTTELAAIKARAMLGEISMEIYDEISGILLNSPIDIAYWKIRDKEIRHDLNAFIDERVMNLPKHLHEHFHKKLTSYDTQEAALAARIIQSLEIIRELHQGVEGALIDLAKKYRYVIMNARTHGQEAELQTFGSRCLSMLAELRAASWVLTEENYALKVSKLSGAIGKYGSIEPQLEEKALAILGFEPFYGATQIMPRVLYLRVAQGLVAIVQVLNNIALNIRLNARSGRPLVREPFSKKQKGSSAMPHKKNPIICEQMAGLDRAARGYLKMIEENVCTWEERSIEQSSVERIAWPDLLHVTARALSEMSKVLTDLQVYPENMILEVYESRGVYASSEVKEFLKEKMMPLGFSYEDAYRVVQLACFNVFELPEDWQKIRTRTPQNLEEAANMMLAVTCMTPPPTLSIQAFIPCAMLHASPELDVTTEEIQKYNHCLREIFLEDGIKKQWDELFKPSFLLKHEAFLYKKIIG